MSSIRTYSRGGLLVLLAAAASLLSCGRDLTGPGLRGPRATLAFAPTFEATATTVGGESYNVASLVPFERVRMVLRRGNDVVVDRLVDFPSSADSVALSATVALSPDAGPEGELLSATLKYINAQGDTVFSGGPFSVLLRAGSSNPPVTIPIVPVGPGSQATRVVIAPDTVIANSGSTVTFTATAYDAQDNVVPNAPVAFLSTDPARVLVPQLGVGSAQLVGARGEASVIAMVLSGATDTALVRITPVPASLLRVSGDAQQALTGAAFAAPLRVRVLASDGLPVVGWPVLFSVTTGGGSVSANIVPSDGDGFAEVTWTAGASAGAASVSASTENPTVGVTFSGTQVASGVASFAVIAQPVTAAAGDNIGPVVVEARNGLGELVAEFEGDVSVTLQGGPQDATLVGTTTVNAVAGVATFDPLAVNRAGTGLRLAFSAPGVATVLSDAFAVTQAPPEDLVLLAGDGQSAPEGSALADSIRVRVTDLFEQPVPGVTVTFEVQTGGGSVAPASAVTDADGRAATRWTVGAAGAQTLQVSVPQLPPLTVTATAVGGGTGNPVLFAGPSSVSIPRGQTVQVPVFLSEPAATPTTVTFTTSNSNIRWGLPSVDIPAGATVINVPLSGDSLGTATAYLSSAAGNDSILVSVTAAALYLIPAENGYVWVGDTLRTGVQLSDPAPPGGVTVVVSVLNPAVFQVAPSNGVGIPSRGCISLLDCQAGLRADEPVAAAQQDALVLLAPPRDSAVVVIPEGQLWGPIALIAVGDTAQGSAFSGVGARAPNYSEGFRNYFVERPELYLDELLNAFDAPLGIGQSVVAYVTTNLFGSTRERRARLIARDPSVVGLDSVAVLSNRQDFSNPIAVRALAAGTTWIVAELPGLAADSSFITVGTPTFAPQVNPAFGNVGRTIETLVRVAGVPGGVAGTRLSDLPFTVRTNPAGVIALDFTSGVIPAGSNSARITGRYVSTGTTYLVFEAAGHAADSVLMTSTLNTLSLSNGPNEVGVGLRHTFSLNSASGPLSQVSLPVTVTSSNPGVLRVLTPTLEVGAGQFSLPLSVEGVSEGSALLSVSGGGISTATFTITVTPSRLVIAGVPPTLAADSTLGVFVSAFTASTSVARGVAATLVASLRSTNPAVLRVVDSLVVFTPGIGATDLGEVVALDEGTADLILTADGFAPDTVTVTVERPAIRFGGAASDVGIGMEQEVWVFREGPPTNALPVTGFATGGNAEIVLDQPAFPAGVDQLRAVIRGLNPGVDTVVVFAEGYRPDTLVIQVAEVFAVLNTSLEVATVGERDEFVTVSIFSSQSFFEQTPASDLRFVIRSSDSTVALPGPDTLLVPQGSFGSINTGSIRYLAAGSAELFLEDVDGLISSDGITVTVDQAELIGSTPYAGDALALGVGQTTYPGEIFLYRPAAGAGSLPVRLRASVPGIVSFPDSVVFGLGEAFLSFQIIAGDSIGSTRITASAPGFADWTLDVVVTRSEFELFTSNTFIGGRSTVFGYVVDALTGYARPLRSPATARLSVENTQVADAGTGTITWPANEFTYLFPGPVGVAPGDTKIYLDDERPTGVARIGRGSADLQVRPPAASFTRKRYSVPLGARVASNVHEVRVEVAGDSLPLLLRSANGRVTVTPDSVLLVQQGVAVQLSPFAVTGIGLGTDTLVASGPGLRGDTTLVVVEPGAIQLLGSPAQTVSVGDSVLVTVRFRANDGSPVEIVTPQQLQFTVPAGFAVSDGTQTVTELPLATGSTGASFWLRAVSDDIGDVTIASANYRNLRLTFRARDLIGVGTVFDGALQDTARTAPTSTPRE